MSIREWPAAERPREKLLQRGSQALSDAELLAIFLRTGIPGLSALDLARQLLQRFGGLRPLLEADQDSFCAGKGLGQAKYVQLQAALEMTRRFLCAQLARGDGLNSPQLTYQYLASQLRQHPNEVFACLYLNNQHQVLGFEILFQGTIDSAQVHPRVVVQKALKYNAAALILAHNHPSGLAEPSQADQQITQRLVQALQLVEIRILDHLIIGDGAYCSLAERGLL